MILCELCPKACRIAQGHVGDCGIRANMGGRMKVLTYGHPTALHMDPMEKKPLYHFLPGSGILSVATVGCNLQCQNCQNWNISQARIEESQAFTLMPEALVALAMEHQSPSIAYTYTEPLTWYEYTLDCCREARKKGIRNVLVTAGYINEKPLRQLLPLVDAANVDLKSMNDDFYRNWCKGTLAPVLRTLKLCREYGVWLEVTNLLVTSMNDSQVQIRDLVKWIGDELGSSVPVHFSRFHPTYRARNLPPTPEGVMEMAWEIAREEGLEHVFLGNLRKPGFSDTYCSTKSCPGARDPLIRRAGYVIQEYRLDKGRCPHCMKPVAGVWQ